MKVVFFLLFTMTVGQVTLAAPLSIQEAWTGVSLPSIMSEDFLYDFHLLPAGGAAKGSKKFWSGDYWAKRSGSINLRWNDPSRSGYYRYSPSKEQAMKMSLQELSRLSPSEKYDLFTGRYHYPVKDEVALNSDPRAERWEGICHGWAPATMNHNEPTPKNMVNPDGIVIPFGSSDIKALLSYYYAFEFKVANTHQMGRRCNGSGRLGRMTNSFDCGQDLNAGAFHVVLANKIGIAGEGFIADMERTTQVWNHPIHSYYTRVLRVRRRGMRSAPGTMNVIRVATTLTYVNETANYWQPIIGTTGQRMVTKEFVYDLDINAFGQIIGGEWISNNHPDFLWTTEKALIWVGEFDRLHELLND